MIFGCLPLLIDEMSRVGYCILCSNYIYIYIYIYISISLFMGQCFVIVRLKKMQTLKIIIKRLQIDYFSGHAKKS